MQFRHQHLMLAVRIAHHRDRGQHPVRDVVRVRCGIAAQPGNRPCDAAGEQRTGAAEDFGVAEPARDRRTCAAQAHFVEHVGRRTEPIGHLVQVDAADRDAPVTIVGGHRPHRRIQPGRGGSTKGGKDVEKCHCRLGASPAGASMLFGHHPKLRPPFNLIISNVPWPRRPLYWNGARLDAVYPLSIPVDGQGLNITCTSNDDIISFGITGCRRTVPHLHTLTSHLGRELDALEHAVGL
ncbi:DUF1298 domain-containing protein [Rhodococcus opacus]|nr:WSD1 family O-acyltransferase [Rhodococcus opacus]QZS58323.1 WSD1 family O-acyltransferase [Rhodococcus opacus]RKM75069.1 DUF1298 domain-containing protein [Rhodococcus opacus]